jgi:hypothetical protein
MKIGQRWQQALRVAVARLPNIRFSVSKAAEKAGIDSGWWSAGAGIGVGDAGSAGEQQRDGRARRRRRKTS